MIVRNPKMARESLTESIHGFVTLEPGSPDYSRTFQRLGAFASKTVGASRRDRTKNAA
jgi:hypothetical protein